MRETLGGPTQYEGVLARKWLAKHGVRVKWPTPLIAVRLGTRHRPVGLRLRYYAIFAVLAVVGAIGYQMLQELPNVRGKDMTESISVFFIYVALQLSMWCTFRQLDRRTVIRLELEVMTPPRPPWWKVLGGWYLAGVALTFGGGAALGIAMFVTTPNRTYAWSWLGLLAIGAVSTAIVLAGVLRAPPVADDEASTAVDHLVRAENADAAFPAMFALPVLLDLLFENRQPHSFTWLMAGYVVLSFGVQLVAFLVHRYRKLPPGQYEFRVAEGAN